MYVGHFAAGFALKARVPRVSTWAVLVGVVFLDLWFSVFVILGLEKVTSTPGVSPGFRLDDIAWSHSLLAAVAWSIVYALFFLRQGKLVALTLGAAVFSHFVLDFPMHPGDLTLYPGSSAHLGLGLWRELPVGWWFVELAFIAACSAYYASRAKADGTFGARYPLVILALLVLHLGNSPWLSLLMR